MSWRRLSRRAVLAIHAEQIAEHGGAPGLRDGGLLDSALARPRNRAAYEEPDVADLAATCAFELVRNHPFVNGNERTGFVAGATFLLLNGSEMTASEGKVVATFRQLAEGSLSEQQLASCSAPIQPARDPATRPAWSDPSDARREAATGSCICPNFEQSASDAMHGSDRVRVRRRA